MKYLALFLALGLAACAAERPYSAEKFDTPMATSEKEYTLAPTDKVHITVYNETSLTGEYGISSNGSISFPLIGEVPAKGLTTLQLSEAIHSRLSPNFFRDASVSVEISAFGPFYVLGEVNKSGQYSYLADMTALQAIASAGGFTYRANKKFIFLKRAGSEEEIKVQITSSLKIHPGDTIRVPERYF